MFAAPMRGRIAILAVAVTAVALVVVLTSTGDGGGGNSELQQLQQRRAPHALSPIPGVPGIDVISPRNGARQIGGAVVVRVTVHNFHLAPRQFGQEPELREGQIRFQLHKVPSCIAPKRLRQVLKSPLGSGNLLGASFDYPQYSGPNGILAERIGVTGDYSPATRPVIYYHGLPVGFYHLVINLAGNDGALTPFHGVTNFQVVTASGRGESSRCKKGKIPIARAPRAFQ